MTDPFTDVADELMTRSTDLGGTEAPSPSTPGARTKKHVCPYCGAVTAVVEKPTGPCPRCNMEDTPATRRDKGAHRAVVCSSNPKSISARHEMGDTPVAGFQRSGHPAFGRSWADYASALEICGACKGPQPRVQSLL